MYFTHLKCLFFPYISGSISVWLLEPYRGRAGAAEQTLFRCRQRADVKGCSVEIKGYSVDGKGCRVDGKGYSVDAKGYSVDVKGYSVDVKGYSVEPYRGRGGAVDQALLCCRQHADVKGYSVDVKAYSVDVKGYSVDAKGYRVDVERITSREDGRRVIHPSRPPPDPL